MRTIAVAVLCALAALAAAGFAWHRQQALDAARLELNGAHFQLQKANADLRSMSGRLEALGKESAEQKMALEQLRSEVASAKAFIEAEKAATLRVREELAKAKEQLAKAGRARGVQPAATQFPAPMLVTPQPTTIRAAPGGAAVGAGARAQ